MLSLILKEEYIHEFSLRPDSLERSLAAALRAVEAAPSNHLAHHALASVQYFLTIKDGIGWLLPSMLTAWRIRPRDGVRAQD